MKANNLIELFGKEAIGNVLITALEGGSNSWYNLHDLSMIKRDKSKSRVDDIIYNVLSDDTIKIPVSDIEEYDEDANEEDVEVLGYLSKEAIENGLELFIKDGRAFTDDMDASEADVFFQFAVLGEIIYG